MSNRVVIIVAHSDDAVLSLGGFLNKTKKKKYIINVFSTCAISTIPGLDNINKITDKNNEEEIEFAKNVNASLYFLKHKEVLLRDYKYWSGEIKESIDARLIKKIYKEIRNKICISDEVYFPISIGDHVDHKILFEIGKKMYLKLGHKIKFFFYEDLPYAKEKSLNSYRIKFKQFKLSKYIDITKEIDKKIEMCYLYKTQYSSPYLNIIKKYANEIAPSNRKSRFFERIWTF